MLNVTQDYIKIVTRYTLVLIELRLKLFSLNKRLMILTEYTVRMIMGKFYECLLIKLKRNMQ